jgi:hypothetical protein
VYILYFIVPDYDDVRLQVQVMGSWRLGHHAEQMIATPIIVGQLPVHKLSYKVGLRYVMEGTTSDNNASKETN